MKDKIYYFQEKSNEILDLQDDFTSEEIGMLFVLKAAYFKYAGELKIENLCQRCKFFGDKEKLIAMTKRLFTEVDGKLVNETWLSEILGIKERSGKRSSAANARWKKAKQKQKQSKTEPKEAQQVLEAQALVDGLQFVLESKLNRKLNTRGWVKQIELLIKDLSNRTNPIEDVQRAIQEVSNRFGEQYFPVIQSASALREKFSKIEAAMNRKKEQGSSSAEEMWCNILARWKQEEANDN